MKKRVNLCVKVDPDLREQFLSLVKEKGFSTCFILETMLRAWTAGTKASKVSSSSTLVVNQKINYMVNRARRHLAFKGDRVGKTQIHLDMEEKCGRYLTIAEATEMAVNCGRIYRNQFNKLVEREGDSRTSF